MFIAQSAVLGAKELWKVKALGKCLFFTWLVLHGRCYRHQSGYNGMVLLGCSYNQEFWFLILSKVGNHTTPTGEDTFVLW
jgi:hypothetical protein